MISANDPSWLCVKCNTYSPFEFRFCCECREARHGAEAVANASASVSSSAVIYLYDWYPLLIKCQADDSHRFILPFFILKGKVYDETGRNAKSKWSSPVVNRINARMVETMNGSTYSIEGPMSTPPDTEEGIDPAILYAFSDGFPISWYNYEQMQLKFMQYERNKYKEENDRLAICNICFTNPKNTVCVPCGHTMCHACANRLTADSCPFCRQKCTHSLFFL